MTGRRLGRNAKFYLNTGSDVSPTWSEVPQFSDLTRGAAWDTAEVNTRESAVKMSAKTMVDFSVSGKLKFVPGDANITTIMDALFSGDTIIDIMVLNGPSTTSGCYGVRFQCQVTEGNEDQGLANAIYEDLKFVPTPATLSPYSVKIVAGAPVMTAI
jgi:hypothetical protein